MAPLKTYAPGVIVSPVDPLGPAAWARGKIDGVALKIPALAGAMIAAPEAGVVRAVWRAPEPGPWEGYPGAGVVIHGSVTRLYHVVYGLDPSKWDYDRKGSPGYYNPPSIGLTYRAGEGVGAAAGLGWIGWEIRRKLEIVPPERLEDLVVDPVELISRGIESPLTPAAPEDSGMGWIVLAVLALIVMGDR